jgi:hypothetical protein
MDDGGRPFWGAWVVWWSLSPRRACTAHGNQLLPISKLKSNYFCVMLARTVQFRKCFGIPVNISFLLIYNRMQVGCPKNRSISWERRRILSSSEPQNRLCAHPPTSYSMVPGGLFRRGWSIRGLKLALTSSGAEVRNEGSYTSIPQYALMTSTGITFPLFTQTGALTHHTRFTKHCERFGSS